jgi:hypothetical protein
LISSAIEYCSGQEPAAAAHVVRHRLGTRTVPAWLLIVVLTSGRLLAPLPGKLVDQPGPGPARYPLTSDTTGDAGDTIRTLISR